MFFGFFHLLWEKFLRNFPKPYHNIKKISCPSIWPMLLIWGPRRSTQWLVPVERLYRSLGKENHYPKHPGSSSVNAPRKSAVFLFLLREISGDLPKNTLQQTRRKNLWELVLFRCRCVSSSPDVMESKVKPLLGSLLKNAEIPHFSTKNYICLSPSTLNQGVPVHQSKWSHLTKTNRNKIHQLKRSENVTWLECSKDMWWHIPSLTNQRHPPRMAVEITWSLTNRTACREVGDGCCRYLASLFKQKGRSNSWSWNSNRLAPSGSEFSIQLSFIPWPQ